MSSKYRFLVPSIEIVEKRKDTDDRYATAVAVWNSPSVQRVFRSGMAGHLVNDVHGMFRKWFHGLKCEVIEKRSAGASEASLDLWFQQSITPSFARGMRSLTGHHTAEDTHWFPQMQQQFPHLKKYFEVLEEDHKQLHPIEDVVLHPGKDVSVDDKCNAVIEFASFLEDHLRREEMLVVPLLLRQDGVRV